MWIDEEPDLGHPHQIGLREMSCFLLVPEDSDPEALSLQRRRPPVSLNVRTRVLQRPNMATLHNVRPVNAQRSSAARWICSQRQTTRYPGLMR